MIFLQNDVLDIIVLESQSTYSFAIVFGKFIDSRYYGIFLIMILKAFEMFFFFLKRDNKKQHFVLKG